MVEATQNDRQIGSFPQIGVKHKDVWNHHPGSDCSLLGFRHPYFLACQGTIMFFFVDLIPVGHEGFLKQLLPTQG